MVGVCRSHEPSGATLSSKEKAEPDGVGAGDSEV